MRLSGAVDALLAVEEGLPELDFSAALEVAVFSAADLAEEGFDVVALALVEVNLDAPGLAGIALVEAGFAGAEPEAPQAVVLVATN